MVCLWRDEEPPYLKLRLIELIISEIDRTITSQINYGNGLFLYISSYLYYYHAMHKLALKRIDSTDLQSQNAGRVALTAFFNLADHWGLSTTEMTQLLGNIKHSRFFEWKKNHNQKIPSDTMERISYLLGIYKSLLILLPEKQAAHAWIKKPNGKFNNISALDFILQNGFSGLVDVRRYLDAERGAHD